MAWETINGNKAAVLAKIETTSGTDAAPALNTDDASWEEFNWNLSPTIRNRKIINPFGPGFRHSIGLVEADFSAVQTIQLDAIPTGDATDVPSHDLAARISGWTRTSNATDKTHTYWLIREEVETATVKFLQAFDGADDYNITELLGCMSDFELSMEPGEPWLYALVNGFAVSQPASAMFAEGGAALTTTYAHDDEGDVRAESNTVHLYVPSTGVLYGGGSLGTPTQSVDVAGYSLRGNRGVTQQKTIGGAFGVKRNRPSAVDRPSTSFQLEQTGYGDLNPFQLLLDGVVFYLGIDTVSPTDADVVMRVGHYLQFTDVSDGGDVDGRRVWDCEADVIFPADVDDNTPAAGASPSQIWRAATGLGLFNDTSITAPSGALVFMQAIDNS